LLKLLSLFATNEETGDKSEKIKIDFDLTRGVRNAAKRDGY
jgi:hypothetical protein